MAESRRGRALFAALALMTILPVPNTSDEDERNAVAYLPAVGVILALILAVVAAVAGALLPPLAAAAVLLITWCVLTGALHLDGLADTADAWMASHQHGRDRVLDIFREPLCGSAAVVALIGVLIAKFAALATLMSGEFHNLIAALLFSLVLSRTAAVFYAATTPYARPSGLGLWARSHGSRGFIAGLALLCALPALLIAGSGHFVFSALLAVCLVTGLTFFWRRVWLKKIGGYTGDILGALIELIEVLCLLCLL